MSRTRGFTLVELVIVITVLGILASVAAPKFIDFNTDSKQAACEAALGGVREAIATFSTWKALPSRKGEPKYPSLTKINKPRGIMSSGIPDNPYSTGADKNAVIEGTTMGVPVTAGTAGAWCYKPSTGEFWADTASGASEAGL